MPKIHAAACHAPLSHVSRPVADAYSTSRSPRQKTTVYWSVTALPAPSLAFSAPSAAPAERLASLFASLLA